MKAKKLSILAAGAAVVATALVPIANVSAWDVSPADGTVIYIRRNINNVSGNVTNTFEYTITPLGTNPEGGATNVPTSASIYFNNVASVDGVATYTGEIDFSSARFSKIGDYGFVITETSSDDASNYPKSSDNYTAWISVRNHVTDGVIDGHVATLGMVGDKNDSKVAGVDDPATTEAIFSAQVVRTYITVDKTVTGTAGDQDKCFDFTINFYNHSDLNYSFYADTDCEGNPSTIPGEGATHFYLKHGETATIGYYNNTAKQIPVGANYYITENEASDYDTYIDGSDSTSKSSSTKTTVADGDPDFNVANVTHFKNEKNEGAKTGAILSIIPFVIIALVGIAGAAYVAKTKKVTE